ncbi:2-dehydro-3-deoxy-phosphogluconate aldolase [Thermoanaerobacterium thermosaccharolyticum]|uniref:Oxo-acid lyase n=1 Tax=Thermoanaerobacterium thermosaccharolyticum M0795 TaxID=698948 RepID=L0IIJ9_THETR|nr:KDGP aldolase [Thermoanaerobacterium thermosaccharolyticum]AGB19315.1 hypothetical protein Thethe_01681 [Thermoanaerobacterium thermosaccharolyticum M0795]
MNLEKYKFYKDKIAFNFLAKTPKNAMEIINILDGNVFIGILSNQFKTVEEGIKYIKNYQKEAPTANISIGLGGGDPNQWKVAAKIAGEVNPAHVNQVFPTAGFTKGYLKAKGFDDTIVNALIGPTGEPGKVKISTGPNSSRNKSGIVDVDTAILMLKDIGIDSIKFYNIHGDSCLEEVKKLAEACARNGFPIIEPTGGITKENIINIIKTCLDAGCEKVIPHIYSYAINKKTGLTDINIVYDIYSEVKKLL